MQVFVNARSCLVGVVGAGHQFVTLRGFLGAAGLSMAHLALYPKGSVIIAMVLSFISVLYKDDLSSTN